MKKLILSGMLVAAIAVAAFSIYKNSSKEEELSDIVKANIEALAEKLSFKEYSEDDGLIGGGGNLRQAYKDISINTEPVPTNYDYFDYKLTNQQYPQNNGKCGRKRMRLDSIDGYCLGN
jgi:hypothetical protein